MKLTVRPAEVRPGDVIPALSAGDQASAGRFVVGSVRQVDAPHPHTRRSPHWAIVEAGPPPRRVSSYDDAHRCIVERS